MSEQKPRQYVGNGKQAGEYYVNFSLKESALKPHFYEYNGERYVRLTIGQNKEVNQYGNTHSIWINDYQPDNNKSETKKATPVSAGDGLPF